jgi:hypothetical protein
VYKVKEEAMEKDGKGFADGVGVDIGGLKVLEEYLPISCEEREKLQKLKLMMREVENKVRGGRGDERLKKRKKKDLEKSDVGGSGSLSKYCTRNALRKIKKERNKKKEEWYKNVFFEHCDASRLKKFDYYCEKEKRKKDISHIYSYNKVMGKECLKDISTALNNTNFKVLIWYFPPKQSESFGLKNVK